jgi:hypothetical protein
MAQQELEGSFTFMGSWKETLLSAQVPGWRGKPPRLKVPGFCSDLLYQPWLCARTPMRGEWLQRDTLPRRSGTLLSLSRFREEFEVPNRPVIITDVV